jgi:hypothetical protein
LLTTPASVLLTLMEWQSRSGVTGGGDIGEFCQQNNSREWQGQVCRVISRVGRFELSVRVVRLME